MLGISKCLLFYREGRHKYEFLGRQILIYLLFIFIVNYFLFIKL